jgi:pyruvate/2-oxoglutarate dehydrogenase complex dihydrolipoamide acyltransferase (E2) component
MYQIKMPTLGMTMLTGTVMEWKMQDGDRVKEGDEIAEVSSETEKLSHVIEAREDGTLRIIAQVGESIKCGSVIGTVE